MIKIKELLCKKWSSEKKSKKSQIDIFEFGVYVSKIHNKFGCEFVNEVGSNKRIF